MSLATEAREYWQVCCRYRGSYSELGKQHAAHVEVPSLYAKSKNDRIKFQLSNIMLMEGIQHDETQFADPCI